MENYIIISIGLVFSVLGWLLKDKVKNVEEEMISIKSDLKETQIEIKANKEASAVEYKQFNEKINQVEKNIITAVSDLRLEILKNSHHVN